MSTCRAGNRRDCLRSRQKKETCFIHEKFKQACKSCNHSACPGVDAFMEILEDEIFSKFLRCYGDKELRFDRFEYNGVGESKYISASEPRGKMKVSELFAKVKELARPLLAHLQEYEENKDDLYQFEYGPVNEHTLNIEMVSNEFSQFFVFNHFRKRVELNKYFRTMPQRSALLKTLRRKRSS